MRQLDDYKKRFAKYQAYDANTSVLVAEFVGTIGTFLGVSMIILVLEFFVVLLVGPVLRWITYDDLDSLFFANTFILVCAVMVTGLKWSALGSGYVKRDAFNQEILDFAEQAKQNGYVEDEKALLEEIHGKG